MEKRKKFRRGKNSSRAKRGLVEAINTSRHFPVAPIASDVPRLQEPQERKINCNYCQKTSIMKSIIARNFAHFAVSHKNPLLYSEMLLTLDRRSLPFPVEKEVNRI